MVRAVGADDWTMLAATIVFTGYCISMFFVTSYNPDLMLGLLSLKRSNEAFKYVMAAMSLYVATTVVLKVALGLFYLRIMPKRWQRNTIYATVAFAVIYGVFFFFFTIFQCGLPTDFLLKELEEKCVSKAVLWPVLFTASLINAISDWTLAVLPILVLSKSKMVLPAKISAGCLISLGALGSICSVVRLVFVSGFMPGPHFFWTSVTLSIWSILECGLCISAASLATLRPMFRCCIENARTRTPSHRQRGKSSAGISGGERSGSFLPLSDIESPNSITVTKSFDIEDADDHTIDTVMSNARAMEKMGVSEETIRKLSLQRSKSNPKRYITA
ncbi:hypothetical protein LTR86_000872 [Recurvomyces mirabilis]|nr:hypothetical protein LTR86_000872 [Recurvomyces mirabilis]